MTDQEITTVISRILKERLPPEAGFRGAEAVSDLDFDGDSIIRITAHYERRPSIQPDPLLESVHMLRSALIEKGENRYIFLKNDVAEEQQIEEDLD